MTHWSKGPKRKAILRKIKKTQFKKGQRPSKRTEFKRGQRPWNTGTKPYVEFVCENCGKEARRPANQKDNKFRFCSTECWYEYQRKNHPRTGEHAPVWKGGKRIGPGGYIMVRYEGHPNSPKSGYVMEHRLVMEQNLGRLLRSEETVHHINGDRADNRIENLQLRQGKHGTGGPYVCLDCGSHNVGPDVIKE